MTTLYYLLININISILQKQLGIHTSIILSKVLEIITIVKLVQFIISLRRIKSEKL